MAGHKMNGEGDNGEPGSGESCSKLNSSVCVEVPVERKVESRERHWALQRRQIHRVPLQLRLKKQQQYVYDPMMVSIGPYHHGKPHLHQMEEFKREALNMFLLSGNGCRDKGFFYNKIFERIDEIRGCYVAVTTNEYDDATLSEMMLHDACFLIYYMKVALGDEEKTLHVCHHLGVLACALINPELNMLENQIPYWVIKLLITSRLGDDEGKALLYNYLSYSNFGEAHRLTTFPWEDEEKEEEPLHLLEASQRILSHCRSRSTSQFIRHSPQIFKFSLWREWRKKKDRANLIQESFNFKYTSRQFYSVTDLKTKGIHFKPSSNCLKDVRFKSHAFYGQLQLPIWFVSSNDYVFLPNMIAFEMSPGIYTDFAVTSYVNFMKTLIESPNDVKELRENGVLFSNLGSDEEVVKYFQEIDTMGMGIDLFYDLKMRIEKHCNSKAKTWIAELINTYFRSPWTVIALLAATFLLILTFLQTYYTVAA